MPILPGTDTAFCLGMMYHQVENNLQNQEFLDTYCVGFDAEHMPEGADPKENFKDYLLGTYDAGMGRGYLRGTCGHYAPSRRGDR